MIRLAAFLVLVVSGCGSSRAPGAATDPIDATAETDDVAPSSDAVPDGPLDASDESSPTPDVADATPDSDADAAIDPDVRDADSGSTDAPDADAAPDAGAPVRCTGSESAYFAPDLEGEGVWLESFFEPCRTTVHPFVIPAGAAWRFEARDLPEDARVFVYPAAFVRSDAAGDPPPPPLGRTSFAREAGAVELEVVAERSGEHFVAIERDEESAAGVFELRAECVARCDLEATRYPILLVHGYAGVDTYFGLVDYFFDVFDRLRERGYDVHRPVTDAIATSELRATQLESQLDVILGETGASRVNVIAHSQGGLDARYLASEAGLGRAEVVASITTVSTPHLGVDAVLWDVFSEQDFSVEAMAEFNERVVDAPAVRYWSWSARTCRTFAFGCRDESDGEVVDPLLIVTYNLLARFGDNDGIVLTSSAVWGEHLGLLFADHFDQVGQVADPERRDDPFDHRAFYLGEARRLAAEGL